MDQFLYLQHIKNIMQYLKILLLLLILVTFVEPMVLKKRMIRTPKREYVPRNDNTRIRFGKRQADCKPKSSSKTVSTTSSDWSDQFTENPSYETTT